MNKRTSCIAIVMITLAFFLAFQPISALSEEVTLGALESQYHYYSYSNTTEPSERESAQTHLVLYSDPREISFISEDLCSVYLINESDFGEYVVNDTINWFKRWPNVTTIQQAYNFEKLTQDFGAPTIVVYGENDTNDDDAEVTRMYFIIVNEVNDTNRYSLRVDYDNEFVIFLQDFFRIVIFATFFVLFLILLRDSKKEKKEDRKVKAHIYRNYAIAFFFGGIVTFIWEIYHWYDRLTPELSWNNPLRFEGMPIPGFSENVLSFMTILSLGLSILFMSYTVEKSIQQKKIAYLSYFLMATEVANIIVAVISQVNPAFMPALSICIYVWIGALALAAINVVVTYIKIARTTTGKLKKQAINIVFSLLITFLVISIGRVYVQPELIANAVCSVAAIWLYKSIKMS
ncbi:MAG: hypothetical protein ACFFCS_17235 [Candidatus Hodarchaeota archaeon]